ncbi:hypothetical protein EDD75_2052 [Thermodesulfitimonas autotrophica]|jgi:hypothetical protein|uniref:DUF2802 domain-containing protein n=1 Tax=Thermodesulfitimonas autotrophica TaxID=1894989 RepID=A0A3N5AE53_9THEO|nr:hypothetical protein [Thermodesulfitimonas autotrophica]RPF42937.1 hypothetical protein EDD75_2052 [Thermodesulfitimonas autotrophica]
MLAVLLATFLLLLLACCGGFFWFLIRFKKQQDFRSRFEEAVTAAELDLESRLVNIENRLENLTSICLELKGHLQWLEQQVGVILSRQTRAKGQLSAYEAVYRAFDTGKMVTELAQEFGRSKGEIELILNLRRMRKEG